MDCITQIPCGPGLSNCMTLSCVEYGDDPVGRAMYICSNHETISGFVYPEGGRPHEWKAPWEACRKVFHAWQDSEAARLQREYKAKEDADRGFVDSIADTLK